MAEKIEVKMPPFSKARPRVTRHGTYMPKAYEEKRATLRALYFAAGGELDPTDPIYLNLVFFFRMPKSWSKKKRQEMNFNYCQKTPDIDNLVGAVMDALIEKDQVVVTLTATKYWGAEDIISIQMEHA